MSIALIILSVLACACASMSAYAIDDGTDYAFTLGTQSKTDPKAEYHKTSFQTGMYVFNILLAIGSVGSAACLAYNLVAERKKVAGQQMGAPTALEGTPTRTVVPGAIPDASKKVV